MRWISAILVLCVSCTFTHEALCHGGRDEASPEWFSHPGDTHHHDMDCETGHDHDAEETDHDSDHHDDDTHDHQFKPLPIKKNPSLQQQITPGQLVMVVDSIPDSIGLVFASSSLQSVIYRVESSLQAYVRAHILLL